MEVIVSIGEKIAECLAGPILRHARYLFCFKRFVGDVEKAKQELKGELADVNKRKEEAASKTEEITSSVKKWLDNVNALFGDVQKLQQELEGRGNKCFNVSLRYSLAKQMEDKAKQMMELKNNSYFEREHFSQPIQLPGITYFSSQEFVDFNSRKSAYNHLLEAIKDAKNKMVGLYGMGGSGKTTLAKEVGKKVDELKLFEKSTKALFGIKNKRILIILDDVWSKLSLEQIGIPLNEGCCVLLTTRLRDLCLDMDCKSIIEVSILIDEEAWALFKMHANLTNVSNNEFDSIGRKIVGECKGLPIAIVTVGSTLKRRGVQVWESTLQKLQRPLPLDVEDDFKTPYAILEVSYDNLPSPLAQSLFLLCSMFPEDHEIHREDLIRFGKGTFKLGDNIYTMEDARKEILITIEKLLDSCLLMHSDKQVCVKMHDLVRDVALWITKKQHQAILVDKHVVSRMLVENETLKETKAISLWNLENNLNLSNQLLCSTLEILLLHSAEGFIEDIGGIESLKVLAFVTFSFESRFYFWRLIQWSMPQSIVSSLMNLHTLCFRGIALGDISFLCHLKRLEILDLHGSQFDELPGGIVDMRKLKLLDVFGCEIEISPLEVIQKCEQLEELYFMEIKSAIPENFSLSGLKRYVIYDSTSEIGFSDRPSQVFDSCDEPLRALSMQGFKVSDLNSSIKDLILRANSLCLDNFMWDHKDINVNIKYLVAFKCPEKRFIVESLDTDVLQTGLVFPNLMTLKLKKMNSLEQVFQDSSIRCSLPMLQELVIEGCPELTAIFTHATIISLPKLRTLQIYGCDKVKYLAIHCPSLEELQIYSCYELERLIQEEVAYGDRLLHQRESHHGNETKKITIRDCSEPESLDEEASHEDILLPLLKLKTLYLSDLPKLREIFGGRFKHKLESLHNKQEYSPHKHKNERVKVVNSELISINLESLPELEYIWKVPTQFMSLHRLEVVTLWQCSRLKHIFTFAIDTSLPELRSIRVDICQEWEGIFCEESLKNLSSSSIVCFPRLEGIWIHDCHKVRRLFSYALASHCPSLEEITIWDCSQLEGVVQAYKGEVAYHHKKLFPKLASLALYKLPKLREIYPGYEFNHLSDTIEIEDCPNICNIPL
ncbi:hypothetical protein K1719_013470 [Acacia pycnantha]|nr:hypothetical protein K1719_013470 [Acacia pycnantha]